jgi:RNA polymerase sigma factor (sigma-70 family)
MTDQARQPTSALREAQERPEVFEAFYREHAQALFVFLARRSLDPQTALELTAETFATAFARRRQFRGRTEAEAAGWLYQIARNLMGKHHRNGVIRRRALERLGMTVPSFSDDDLERVEQLAGLDRIRRSVREEFDSLPPKQRDAVSLRVVDELPYPEVADRLGISEQTARARVSRGLRTLRDLLAAPQPGDQT